MCAMRKDPSAIRLARFEAFESRVMLSADAAADFVADFAVDYSFDDYLLDPALQIALRDAHNLTGLTSAQNAYGLDGSGQTVVIIDTGTAYSHTALGGGYGAGYTVVGGYDFAENDADPYDDGAAGSHGTHVAGIIAGNNGSNSGVAPGVDVVSLRVFDDNGQGTFEWVEKALQWVITNIDSFANPITTINMSLGVVYNSNAVPSWATLEDELAVLSANGIFISVAAGNKFASYNAEGLSYPAVSQYVVPVASLNPDGSLSSYSQRSDRVIAAPGRSITSTVPDYAGNDNGIDDDYATYSGTSMASPYVAGAAVLIRQAFAFAGMENVTQADIYNLMCSTADTVYDPVTGKSYCSLNISAALDAIMPADDFGSTQSAAHSLGTITDTLSLGGAIGRRDDADWFSFTAAQSGVVTFSLEAANELAAKWSVSNNVAGVSISGGTLSFEVTAGATYSIGLSSGDGIGNYSLDAVLQSAGGGNNGGGNNGSGNNWGTISQTTVSDLKISSAGAWFSFTASAGGILTVESMFNSGKGDIDIELYGADGKLLAGSYGMSNSERIDVAAQAGQQFLLRAVNLDPGTNDAVDFRVTNLVSQQGNVITVNGTAGDDVFAFATGSSHQITVNGVSYSFNSSRASSIKLDGAGGNDSLSFTAGSGGISASLSAAATTVQGSGYSLTAAGFENVSVRAGSAGGTAILYDSAGDDTLVAAPQYSVLSGAGFSLRAEGFSSVLASASSGNDTAKFHDSAGNDTFLATPTYSRLQGQGFYLRAKGFDAVTAAANAGGYDSAYLFDSSGNDALAVSPGSATLAGSGFSIRADAFEYVNAKASGGTDTASFQAPAGGAQYASAASYAILSGNNYSIRADSFDRVHTQSLAVAAAAVAAESSTAGAIANLDHLDHVLAQESFAETYAFEYARRELLRDSSEVNDESQALDSVLAQLENWT